MKLTERIYLCGSGAFGITPAGDCHCYVLDGKSELALVDCGMQKDPRAILTRMEQDGLDPGKLRYILLTHAHPDHANACEWFRNHMGVQIVASAFEAAALEHGLLETLKLDVKNVRYEQYYHMCRCRADRIVEDGELLLVGDLTVETLLTPGHTAGSTSYLTEIQGKRELFTGDEVFYQGFVSVLAPPFSDYEHYYDGLKRLKDQKTDGLFPSHLMWTLRDGQKHIDKALWDFEVPQRPNLKLFS